MYVLEGISFQKKPVSFILKIYSGLHPLSSMIYLKFFEILLGDIFGWLMMSLHVEKHFILSHFWKGSNYLLLVWKSSGYGTVNGLGCHFSVSFFLSPLSNRLKGCFSFCSHWSTLSRQTPSWQSAYFSLSIPFWCFHRNLLPSNSSLCNAGCFRWQHNSGLLQRNLPGTYPVPCLLIERHNLFLAVRLTARNLKMCRTFGQHLRDLIPRSESKHGTQQNIGYSYWTRYPTTKNKLLKSSLHLSMRIPPTGDWTDIRSNHFF